MRTNCSDNNINFQAFKVLTTIRKDSKTKSKTVTDTYKLSEFDRPFIERCLAVCQGKDRSIKENEMNIHYKANSKEALKGFFKSFLSNESGDYFIAIKNKSNVSGVLRLVENDWTQCKTDPGKMTKKLDINTRLVLDSEPLTKNTLNNAALEELISKIKHDRPTMYTDSIEITCNVDGIVIGGGGDTYFPEFPSLKNFRDKNINYKPQYTYEKGLNQNLAKILDID